ncbi:hypothetical protein XELAEV_18018715mg [Xenopus laevis]|uniref:G-protein coupled receptors family 1 profile domain-containing protein n=1 Tax=Xenopus laevis TaxID=8355 RepID=A0A974DDI4_XENLA|nr:hypothetical protein XELAEV_18018715mg [Xenopus laevis]
MDNHTQDQYFYICLFSDSPVKRSICFIVFLLIYTMVLIGNLLLISATLIDSHLKAPMYFFLRNLSFVDICFTSVTLPKLMDIFLTGNNAVPFALCFAQLICFGSIVTTEILLLTSMAYDRYVAICNPLCYFLVMNNRRNALLVLSSWITVGPFSLCLASYAKIISNILKIKSAEGRKKTFSTCTAHLTVLLLFYGTIICMYINPLSIHSEIQDQLFTFFYLAVTPTLNPLIYSLRNQEVKKALNRMFNWQIKLTYFQN